MEFEMLIGKGWVVRVTALKKSETWTIVGLNVGRKEFDLFI